MDISHKSIHIIPQQQYTNSRQKHNPVTTYLDNTLYSTSISIQAAMKLLSSLLFITTAGVIGIYAQEYEIPNHQLRGELDNSSSSSTSSTNNNNNDTILKERAKSAFSYTEDIGPGLKLDMALHTVHHSTLSEYQSIQVIDTYFGRTLVTDGKTQSAAHDEYVYHESLVHPPSPKYTKECIHWRRRGVSNSTGGTKA